MVEEQDVNNFKIISLQEIDNLPRKMKKNKRIIVDVSGYFLNSGTKYDLLRTVSNSFDWNIQEKSDQKIWNIKWYDYYVQEDDIRKMLPFQKINHFPGSNWQSYNHSLGKKNNLGKYLHKLQKIFPNYYNFFPKTWILPYQLEDLRHFFLNKSIDKSQKYFIAKPEAGCQGRGIYLFNKLEVVEDVSHSIVQQYIANPFLIDGLKFDCRLYVLIKSLDPLKIFLYKDGLARFATEPFKKPKKKNLDNYFMHLTNYSVNKKNDQFKQNFNEDGQEQGHKRSLSSIFEMLKNQGHDVDELLKKIRSIIVKTIAAVQPMMAHAYKTSRPKDEQLEVCFEILGFDILIDSDLKPWLIEVIWQQKINHTPSFQTDSKLDFLIKKNLITDTLILMKIKSKDRKIYNEVKSSMPFSSISRQIMTQCNRMPNQLESFENKNLNGFMRVYPTFPQENSTADINSFIDGAKKIWDAWAGPKNKNLLQEALQTRQKHIEQKITSEHKPKQTFALQQKQSSVCVVKRPPSAQLPSRPPSAFQVKQKVQQQQMNKSQTPKQSTIITNEPITKQQAQSQIQPQSQTQNFFQESINDQSKEELNKSQHLDQFKSIQEFLNNTNQLYNNYLQNINQQKPEAKIINKKSNRNQRRIPLYKPAVVAPIIVQNNQKHNFKIQGNSYTKQSQQMQQEGQTYDSYRLQYPGALKPRQKMNVMTLNQLNQNFISINSKQNIYADE